MFHQAAVPPFQAVFGFVMFPAQSLQVALIEGGAAISAADDVVYMRSVNQFFNVAGGHAGFAVRGALQLQLP